MIVTSDYLIGVIAGWAVVVCNILLVCSFIWVLIFGGCIKYESEGLIPKMKRWKRGD